MNLQKDCLYKFLGDIPEKNKSMLCTLCRHDGCTNKIFKYITSQEKEDAINYYNIYLICNLCKNEMIISSLGEEEKEGVTYFKVTTINL